MSSEMIERVARAIKPQVFADYEERVSYALSKGDTQEEAKSYANSFSGKERAYLQARAAIEAMREPTEAMMTAGWVRQFMNAGATFEKAVELSNNRLARDQDVSFLKEGWSSAIDAALSEDPSAT